VIAASPAWLWGARAGAPVLLALLPLLSGVWTWTMLFVFLQQPAYMLHQIEEHSADRFRAWVNDRLNDGLPVLTPTAVAIINIGGVWAVNAASLLLTGLIDTGFGLIAVYLTLVNAAVHILGALALRGYNPGLITAVLLFLPLGGAGLVLLAPQPWGAHLGALAFVTGGHAAIVIYVRHRRRALGPRRAPHAAGAAG
jgi:Protein of unknown function with HXXEE motif